MGKQKVLTDRLNTYFTKNKITIGSSVPTIGSYVTGDIVISSSPNTSAFGWICTSSGSPGSWKILKSGNDITKAEVEKVLTGTVTSHTHNYAGSSSVGGSANSAVKLATARAMTVGNTSKAFDGTSNVSWSLGEIGALPLTGGNMTGNVNMTNNTAFLFKTASALTNSAGVTINAGTLLNMITYNNNHNLHIGSGIFDNKINTGSTYISGGKDVYVRTTGTNGNFYVSIGGTNRAVINSSGITGTLIGNASTATKLATARTINGTTFDGTGDITTANWGTARSIYIADSSASNTGAAVSVNGGVNATLKLPPTIKATLTGNASTATTLATARTITVGKTSRSFNGSTNVSWTLDDIGAAPASHTHSYLPLTGGTVSGETIFTQGTRIHSGEGTGGTTGYVNIAQISVTGTYANQPFTFLFAQRGNGTTSRVHLAFTNVDTTDPAVDNFNVEGPGDVYIHKSATSTWQIYIKKTGENDKIDILDFNKGSYGSRLKVTWKNTHASSVPSGFIQAETRAYHNHRLVDLHTIDPDTGLPIGNSSSAPIGTTYVRNSAKLHVGRFSCYHNADTGTDYTAVSLYNLANKANATYLNIYPDYVYSNKKFHVNGPIRIDGHYLSIQASAPSSPAAGDIWIDI